MTNTTASLNGFLASVSTLLSPVHFEQVKELAVVGETLVGYENLCTQLYEYDCKLTQQQMEEASVLGKSLGADPKYWQRLGA